MKKPFLSRKRIHQIHRQREEKKKKRHYEIVWVKKLNEDKTCSGTGMTKNQQQGKLDHPDGLYQQRSKLQTIFLSFTYKLTSWKCFHSCISWEELCPASDKRLLTPLSHLAHRVRRMENAYEVSGSSTLLKSTLILSRSEKKGRGILHFPSISCPGI